MKGDRPVNLDLTKVRFPITAIASILHRVSAVIVWVGLGFLLCALCTALESPEGFQKVQTALQENFFAKFVLWGLLTALAYYCAGTAKHLIQDLGFFEEFAGGKKISWAAILIGVALSVYAGVKIWL